MTWNANQPNYRREKFWTAARQSMLVDMIGEESYATIAAKVGVGVEACRKQAARLGHRLDRGTTTLRALARDTGYDRHQLRRARRELGQKWGRAKRKLLIRADQEIELINFLRDEE